jgi:hypothetical protein
MIIVAARHARGSEEVGLFNCAHDQALARMQLVQKKKASSHVAGSVFRSLTSGPGF